MSGAVVTWTSSFAVHALDDRERFEKLASSTWMARSDAEGSFQFEHGGDSRPGYLWVTAPGKLAAYRYSSRGLSALEGDFEWVLEDAESLRVSVVRGGGHVPVPGARVRSLIATDPSTGSGAEPGSDEDARLYLAREIESDSDGFGVVSSATGEFVVWAEDSGVSSQTYRTELSGTLEIQLPEATRQRVRVLDSRLRPIQGAKVCAVFHGEPYATEEVESDEEGSAWVTGVPEERVWFRAVAEGFVTGHEGPWSLPMDSESIGDVLEIVLTEAGALEGVVTSDGVPVDTFVLSIWEGSGDAVLHSFKDREDGTFSIPMTPAGAASIRVFSATHRLGPTPVINVEIPQGEAALLRVELEPSILGRGKIVDGDTAAPIEGAKIIAHINSGGLWKGSFGDQEPEADVEVRSARDGTWVSPGFSIGRCNLEVVAEGYPDTTTSTYSTDGGDLDFGVLPLFKGRDLRVRVAGLEGEALSGATVQVWGTSDRAPIALDSNGTAVFEDLPLGLYNVWLSAGDDRSWNRPYFLTSDHDQELFFSAAGNLALDLAFVDFEGRSRPWKGWVVALPVGVSTREPRRYYWVEGDTEFTMRGLEYSEVIVRTIDAAGAFHGEVHCVASAGTATRVDIRIDDNPAQVLVVDRMGEPISGVEVIAQNQGCGRNDSSTGVTNTDGVVQLAVSDTEPLLVWLRHWKHGDVAGVPVFFPSDGSRPRLVMDGTGIIRAKLRCESEPLVGVSVVLEEATMGVALSIRAPDSGGRVEFRDIGPGKFRLRVEGPGLWPVHIPLESQRVAGSWVEVDVLKTCDLDLELRSETSEAIQSLEILHTKLDESVTSWLRDGRATGILRLQPSSPWTLHGVASGSYTWTAELADGTRRKGSFHSSDGAAGEPIVLEID